MLLGVRIDSLKLSDLLARVHDSVRTRSHMSVMYVNAHCMNAYAVDPAYREALDGADVVYCDGTGVRLAARLARMYLPARMTGADWIHDLCRDAVDRDERLFFVGGAPGVAADAARVLRQRYPGVQIVGTASGFDLGPELIFRINSSQSNILLTGMGTPHQEKWIAENRATLQPCVVWAVGALFDFVSGRIPRGPHWMTEHGLEWLCRLAAEPRKLWRRYLIGNPRFVWRVIRTYWIQMPSK